MGMGQGPCKGLTNIPQVLLRGEKLQKAKHKALEPLTALQRRFLEELVVDLSITKAALRADFSPKTGYATGSRLLKKPEMREAFACLLAEKAEIAGITANRILTALWHNHRKALRGTPVFSRLGDLLGYKPDIASSNRALELLGKHCGIFTDRVDVTSAGEKITPSETTTQVMIINGAEVEF
jgi:phage terminase small subunit